ncbi:MULTISPECIES: glycosyltransferase family 4 protein [Arthrobacter]|uniref:Glycosyltransferase n=1 Tax=Arthrobacter terricola TaxID=2547396 RepID=A0A4R5KHJ6_9MICC|nr:MULTISPECIES: glycosyltransferase family 4 protein [Arthrobacter]MBT8159258.1 glycosyltransferase family 4 protein [Arthrobacter sp. GN70]TDF94911.1 glycosyltransferase [Arthrobacter terricola]
MVSKFREFQGGVEAHLRDLMGGLTELGHQVELFSSEDVPGNGGFSTEAGGFGSKARSVASLFWNSSARKSLAKAIEGFEPDLVHYHSIYHQLSPSVLGVSRVPTVMTLHDYKLVAPCYSLYRDSRICTDCVGLRFPLPAILNRCVKQSAVASAVCSSEQVFYKNRYLESVDRFIVPSAYLQGMLIESGVPADQMAVVPWGVPADSLRGDSAEASEHQDSRFLLYAGRLHESKGLRHLLEAWSALEVKGGYRLLVVGGGPLESEVKAASSADSTIEYMGLVNRDRLLDLIAMSTATVMPSIVPETMGLAALESLVRGIPVVLTGSGALSELAGAGVIEVDPETLVTSLRETFSKIVSDPTFLRMQRSELAKRDLSMYTQAAMVGRVMEVYEATMRSCTNSAIGA